MDRWKVANGWMERKVRAKLSWEKKRALLTWCVCVEKKGRGDA